MWGRMWDGINILYLGFQYLSYLISSFTISDDFLLGGIAFPNIYAG